MELSSASRSHFYGQSRELPPYLADPSESLTRITLASHLVTSDHGIYLRRATPTMPRLELKYARGIHGSGDRIQHGA